MATMTYTTKDGLTRQHELSPAGAELLSRMLGSPECGQWFFDSDGWCINLVEVLTLRFDGPCGKVEASMNPNSRLAEFRRVSEHLRDMACNCMSNGYDAQLACMDVDRLQALMESACLGAGLPEGGE